MQGAKVAGLDLQGSLESGDGRFVAAAGQLGGSSVDVEIGRTRFDLDCPGKGFFCRLGLAQRHLGIAQVVVVLGLPGRQLASPFEQFLGLGRSALLQTQQTQQTAGRAILGVLGKQSRVNRFGGFEIAGFVNFKGASPFAFRVCKSHRLIAHVGAEGGPQKETIRGRQQCDQIL